MEDAQGIEPGSIARGARDQIELDQVLAELAAAMDRVFDAAGSDWP